MPSIKYPSIASLLIVLLGTLPAAVAADTGDSAQPLASTMTGSPVRISGVDPHLAVTNAYPEAGICAVVPRAYRL